MHEPRAGRSTLVTDWDGTLTRRQFYQLVRDRLTPASTPDYWHEYREGRRTHFDTLNACFASAAPDEQALAGLVHEMELEENLAAKIAQLEDAGWDIVVASAGCAWYIERLLAGAGVRLPVVANPGRIVEGRLVMEPVDDRRFASPDTGVDKARVVRSFQEGGGCVAFAGDGYPDVEAALAVPAHLRFARADLAAVLDERGEPFRSFDRWGDVVHQLIDGQR